MSDSSQANCGTVAPGETVSKSTVLLFRRKLQLCTRRVLVRCAVEIPRKISWNYIARFPKLSL